MAGAVDYLLRQRPVTATASASSASAWAAAWRWCWPRQQPDEVGACAPFYGLIPWPDAEPDWSKLQAPVLGHFAEKTASSPRTRRRALEAQLRDLGKDAEFFVYPRRRPRLLQRHPARGVRRGSGPRGVGAHHRLLQHAPGLAADSLRPRGSTGPWGP